jgi:NADH-quinone oxidoreductase subunit G
LNISCEILLDGEKVRADVGTALLPAILQSGVAVPHLCFHPQLSVPASCQVCTIGVGVGQERQLRTACNVMVEDGLVVDTRSTDVLAARQQALEFALLRHAADCPVCSKAGECEVQNGVRDWGRERGRFAESRSRRPQRRLGAGLDLYPDRCVGCSRCIRFSEEISLSGELYRVGRGEVAEVDIAPGRELDNPLAGNLVDLCPAGAIVDSARAYGPPPWLLEGVDSVCTRCSSGCPVRVDVYRGKVERVVARGLPSEGKYWVCDEGRYGWKRERMRLSQPRIRRGEREWDTISWERAFAEVVRRIKHLQTGCGQVAVFLSAGESNEVNYLLARLARDLWQAEHVGLFTHEIVATDQHFGGGFVIRADQAANALGAAEMVAGNGLGVAAHESIWAAIEQGAIRAVYVLDGLRATVLDERAKSALSAVEFLVVQGAIDSELAELADVFLAGAGEFEKEGTYTNADGCVQRVRQAVDLPSEVLPDWALLLRLASELGMDWDYAGIEEITTEIGQRVQGRYANFDYWDAGAEDRGDSAQAYGGGWATWLQRKGLLAVEDHTKRVRR